MTKSGGNLFSASHESHADPGVPGQSCPSSTAGSTPGDHSLSGRTWGSSRAWDRAQPIVPGARRAQLAALLWRGYRQEMASKTDRHWLDLISACRRLVASPSTEEPNWYLEQKGRCSIFVRRVLPNSPSLTTQRPRISSNYWRPTLNCAFCEISATTRSQASCHIQLVRPGTEGTGIRFANFSQGALPKLPDAVPHASTS